MNATPTCGRCDNEHYPLKLTTVQVTEALHTAAKIEGITLTTKEVKAALKICAAESGYRRTVKNPRSTAYGLYQFLDRTWRTVGVYKTSCAVCQSVAFIRYVKKSYGTMSRAYTKRNSRGWY